MFPTAVSFRYSRHIYDKAQTCTVSQKSKCVGYNLLRMPCGVSNGKTKDQDECGVVRSSEVIAPQPSHMPVQGNESKSECTGKIRKRIHNDEEAPGVSFQSMGTIIVQIYAAENGQGNHNTIRDLKKRGDQCRESEALDNDGPEVTTRSASPTNLGGCTNLIPPLGVLCNVASRKNNHVFGSSTASTT